MSSPFFSRHSQISCRPQSKHPPLLTGWFSNVELRAQCFLLLMGPLGIFSGLPST